MRIYRLAQLLEQKYSFTSEAADPVRQDKILQGAITTLVDNFNLYVDPKSPHNRTPVLGILLNMGEPFTSRFVDKVNILVSKLDDEAEPHHMLQAVNELLQMMYQMKQQKTEINNFVIDNFRLSRQADKNYRDRVITKYWATISIIFSVYQKVARSLQILAPDMPVPGGSVEPQRGEISRDKWIAFLHGPAAQQYGLVSQDVLGKVLADPQLKEKLTTLVNAIDRGHTPLDGPAVFDGVREIMEIYNQKQRNNSSFFESNEPVPQAIEPEEEKQ